MVTRLGVSEFKLTDPILTEMTEEMRREFDSISKDATRLEAWLGTPNMTITAGTIRREDIES